MSLFGNPHLVAVSMKTTSQLQLKGKCKDPYISLLFVFSEPLFDTPWEQVKRSLTKLCATGQMLPQV